MTLLYHVISLTAFLKFSVSKLNFYTFLLISIFLHPLKCNFYIPPRNRRMEILLFLAHTGTLQKQYLLSLPWHGEHMHSFVKSPLILLSLIFYFTLGVKQIFVTNHLQLMWSNIQSSLVKYFIFSILILWLLVLFGSPSASNGSRERDIASLGKFLFCLLFSYFNFNF